MRGNVSKVIEIAVGKETRGPQPTSVGGAVDEKGWPIRKPAMR
jgi:hypothetical protein